MNVKANNYFTIQGWMVTDLQLKGNDLLVYAIVYGFSQTKNQYYTGGLKYLEEWTNSSKPGVLKNLKHLVETGLIEKKEVVINGVKYAHYKANDVQQVFNNSQQVEQNKVYQGSEQSLPGVVNRVDQGGKLSLPDAVNTVDQGGKQSRPILYNTNNNILYNNKNKDSADKSADVCVKKRSGNNPTLEEIKLYILDNNFNVDAEEFFDYYDNLNWMAGKSKLKNWKAKVRAWDRKAASDKHNSKGSTTSNVDKYKFVINDFGDDDNSMDKYEQFFNVFEP